MSMRHYFDTIINPNTGIMQGIRVRLTNLDGSAANVYADDGGTRFRDDAGNIINVVTSDQRGLIDFYVPFNTYNINYYSPVDDFLYAIQNVYMGSDATDALIAARDAALAAASVADIDAASAAADKVACDADVVLTHADVVTVSTAKSDA